MAKRKLFAAEDKLDKLPIAHVVGQFYSCTLTKDGGGRLTLEFGAESLQAIQQIQTWHNEAPTLFAVAIKPLDN